VIVDNGGGEGEVEGSAEVLAPEHGGQLRLLAGPLGDVADEADCRVDLDGDLLEEAHPRPNLSWVEEVHGDGDEDGGIDYDQAGPFRPHFRPESGLGGRGVELQVLDRNHVEGSGIGRAGRPLDQRLQSFPHQVGGPLLLA